MVTITETRTAITTPAMEPTIPAKRPPAKAQTMVTIRVETWNTTIPMEQNRALLTKSAKPALSASKIRTCPPPRVARFRPPREPRAGGA